MENETFIYPLAKPCSFIKDDLCYGSGIASFYLEYNGSCYVYLLGHNSGYSMNKMDVYFHSSYLLGQDISETIAYKIQYQASYDTEMGVFLKRNEVSGLKDFQSETFDTGEPKLGTAILLTTIDGFIPQAYSCVIREVYPESINNLDFGICINDLGLIELCGGGQAGMSGSVIIQDNKIVGVLAAGLGNKSNYGFGVSINYILLKLREIDGNRGRKESILRRILATIK